MKLVEKIIEKKIVADSISNYLKQIEKESSEDCEVCVNVDGSIGFKSSFRDKEIEYCITKKEFFAVCKDAKNAEEVKERIDALIVQKYYEKIIE